MKKIFWILTMSILTLMLSGCVSTRASLVEPKQTVDNTDSKSMPIRIVKQAPPKKMTKYVAIPKPPNKDEFEASTCEGKINMMVAYNDRLFDCISRYEDKMARIRRWKE